MATVYKAANATGLASGIPTLVEQGQFGGKVRKMYDSYTLAADLIANDTILIGGLLPEGARLVDCKLVTEALGGSAAISIGWQASTDLQPNAGGETLNALDSTGFFNAFVVSSAQKASAWSQSTVGAGGQGDFFQTVLTSNVQPVITCNVATSGATGKKIKVEIEYVID